MKYLILLLAVASCNIVFGQPADADALVKTGDIVPAFSFEIEKGKTVNITDYKGKLVLINFFATWCPPCRAELPEIQKQVWAKYKDNEKFTLLVFGREEDWDVLNAFKKKFKYTFPILPDMSRRIFSRFATQSIPRNVLIDGEGKIIYQSVGYDEKEFKAMLAIIDKALAK